MIIWPFDEIIRLFYRFIGVNRVIPWLIIIVIVFILLSPYIWRVPFLPVTHSVPHISLLTCIITHWNSFIVINYLIKSIPILDTVTFTATVQIHQSIRYKQISYCLSKCLMDCLSYSLLFVLFSSIVSIIVLNNWRLFIKFISFYSRS